MDFTFYFYRKKDEHLQCRFIQKEIGEEISRQKYESASFVDICTYDVNFSGLDKFLAIAILLY